MRQSRPRGPIKPALPSWAIASFELGYLDADHAFSVEHTVNAGANGKLGTDSENRRVVISGGSVEVHISDFSISQIRLLSCPTELLFTLDHAPFFGSRNHQKQLIRREAIDGTHAKLGQVVNQQILVSFRDPNERQRFCSADRRWSLPKPKPSKVSVVVRGLYSPGNMAQVEGVVTRWPGPVAFQVSFHLV